MIALNSAENLAKDVEAHPFVDPHGTPDLVRGDGHALVLEQLLEGQDWSEDPGVDDGAWNVISVPMIFSLLPK